MIFPVASIYQIAEETGVSPKTVARILAGDSKRSKHFAKVTAAARKLGYVRNQQAANLRSGVSKLIGVVVPDLRNPFYPKFVQTIHDTCLQAGYQIFLSSTFGNVDEELRALNLLRNYRVDGIVFNASESQSMPGCDALLEELVSEGRPIVMAGRDRGDLPVDQIKIQNVEATKKLIAYLAKTGHRRIGYLGGEAGMMAFDERAQGYREGMAAVGLKQDAAWMSFGESTDKGGRERVASLLDLPSGRRPTAIVGGNDLLAIGALKCLLERGISVPGEVAVAGFDDIHLSSLVHPGLTTLRQPQERIAEECVKLLLQRIRTRDLSHPRTLIYDADLIVRESA